MYQIYQVQRLTARKIHIVGGNKVGYLIAHSLRASCPSNTTITLHFHRLRQADTFNAVYGLTVVNPFTGIPVFRDGFHYDMKDLAMRRAIPIIPDILEMQRRKEYIPAVAAERIRTLHEDARHPPRLDDEGYQRKPIELVIIAKRGGESLRVVEALKDRLSRNSTIVLIHNGMGLLSQVQAYWPREAERPNIIEGFNTHGLSNQSEFTIHHTARGHIHLGIAPRLDENDIFHYTSLSNTSLPSVLNSTRINGDPRFITLGGSEKHKSLKYILNSLLTDPTLNCTLRAYLPDLYLLQLKRVICQAILQTLGALQRCTNGELIRIQGNHEIIGKLIREILPVIDADPLISSSPIYKAEFTFAQLYTSVRNMALAAPNAVSIILQDMAGRRETELGFLSGFLLLLARKRGFKLPMWRSVHELVKAGARLEQTRHDLFVPLIKGGEDESADVMGIPDGTGVFDKRYWRLESVTEGGHVDAPWIKAFPGSNVKAVEQEVRGDDGQEESLSSQPTEDKHDGTEIFSMDSSISKLSRKLKIASSPPPTEQERRLPPVRVIRQIYHPWLPYRHDEVAREREIDMHQKWRKKKKTKRRAALEAAVRTDNPITPKVNTTEPDQQSLSASAAIQSEHQTEASDPQMVDYILQQLESTIGATSSQPATLFPAEEPADQLLARLLAHEEPQSAEPSSSDSSSEAPRAEAIATEPPPAEEVPGIDVPPEVVEPETVPTGIEPAEPVPAEEATPAEAVQPEIEPVPAVAVPTEIIPPESVPSMALPTEANPTDVVPAEDVTAESAPNVEEPPLHEIQTNVPDQVEIKSGDEIAELSREGEQVSSIRDTISETEPEAPPSKRGRGRPRGSKNKPKY